MNATSPTRQKLQIAAAIGLLSLSLLSMPHPARAATFANPINDQTGGMTGSWQVPQQAGDLTFYYDTTIRSTGAGLISNAGPTAQMAQEATGTALWQLGALDAQASQSATITPLSDSFTYHNIGGFVFTPGEGWVTNLYRTPGVTTGTIPVTNDTTQPSRYTLPAGATDTLQVQVTSVPSVGCPNTGSTPYDILHPGTLPAGLNIAMSATGAGVPLVGHSNVAVVDNANSPPIRNDQFTVAVSAQTTAASCSYTVNYIVHLPVTYEAYDAELLYGFPSANTQAANYLTSYYANFQQFAWFQMYRGTPHTPLYYMQPKTNGSPQQQTVHVRYGPVVPLYFACYAGSQPDVCTQASNHLTNLPTVTNGVYEVPGGIVGVNVVTDAQGNHAAARHFYPLGGGTLDLSTSQVATWTGTGPVTTTSWPVN